MEVGYGMDFDMMDEGLKMDQSRNILQRMGAPGDKRSQEEGGYSSNMNIKQEGPFLVPSMWKNNLSLENIANDFLESNVTGEVMNLDDFLKELQVNEIMQQSPGGLSSRNQVPRGHTGGREADRKGMDGGREMAGGRDPRHTQDRLQDMHDRYSMIRPANIDELKEQIPIRPPIMHHVGKPPELYQKHQETSPHQHANSHPHASPHPHVSPHQGMPQVVPHQHARDSGIPQASVRPLVRPVNQSPERLDRLDRMDRGERMDRMDRMERMDRMDRMDRMERMKREMDRDDSEKRLHDMSQDESDGDDSQMFQNGFTSTVCVKFSEDDLRIATIPGQEFDPATRRFSEEELKPQPIIRKRKKQFVPDELKNNKYWAKRCKNNEAAKRSREARRLKENQIAMRARYLEEENNALKGEVNHLKKENTDLKQMMVSLEEKLNQMTDNR